MQKHINYYFLTLAGILMISGLLFLSTLSAISSLQAFGNTNHYLFHQLIGVAIGLVLGALAYKTPMHVLRRLAPWFFFFNLAALLLVFLPGIGTKFWGASRWISIGDNTFQPSEFFKISAILYLSAWICNKFSGATKRGWVSAAKKGHHDVVGVFLPFLCLLGIIAIAFYLQRDISTLGILSITLMVMYFEAGTPLWHTILAIALGAGGALAVIIKEPYRFQRLLIFLHPETDPLGIGLQLKQSLIAVGSGGIFGKGLGMSTQKFGFLPQAMSDSIFAILGEETGIVGCLVLIALFLLFLWLGFSVASRATEKFSKLVVIGISTWIVLQAFVNVASSIGLFPLSGIPLPFFSYGGSHVIAELIGVGIILNVSRNG